MTILNSIKLTQTYYNPDRLIHFPPERVGYHPEELSFLSAKDGTRLHGWYFRSKVTPAKGTIVQFHGNSQNISSQYASLVWLTNLGYHLFTFDYRGFGKSAGVAEPKGAYEDGVAALQLAWKMHRAAFPEDVNKKQDTASRPPKFIVYTQSMGGMIGVRAFADFSERKRTSALIIDSSFASFKDIVEDTMKRWPLTWPFAFTTRFLVSDRWAMQWVLPTLTIPVLVIHDKKDPIVRFHHGQKIFGLLAGRKQFWELEEGGHVNIFTNSKANRERFLAYLNSL